MSRSSSGFILGSSSVPSSSLCFCFMFGYLVYLGHHWMDFLEGATGNWVQCPGLWPRQTIHPLAPAPPFVARETLRAWQEKNHPWLELSDVHRETTENIRVTVIPFYMGMRVCAQPAPLSSGLGRRILCGVPNMTAGAGCRFHPCACGSASKCYTYSVGLNSLLTMAGIKT